MKEIEEKKLIALLRENYNELIKNIRYLQDVKTIQTTIDKEIAKLEEVKKEIQSLQGGIPAKVEITNHPAQKEFPKEIKINNFPEPKEFPKSLEISNLKDLKIPEFPKKIEAENKSFTETVKELGIIKGFLAKISEKINNFKQSDSVFIRNKTTDEAIPVKLTDKEGKRFYNAIAAAIGAGWPSIIAVTGTFYQATQPVSGTVTVIHGITGIGHGIKTVTTAGTDEALAGSTACKKVIIQSQTDNTGLIAVGTSGVDATEATGTGIILYAGDALEIEIDNLADVYIDATVSGEGVRYTYFT